MTKRKLRIRLAGATSLGVAVATVTMTLGAGAAFAGAPADPATGYPSFYNGNVEGIRDSGSDTTFFMMQKIGDLYTAAGLYGCTLNNALSQTLYNSGDTDTSTDFESFCQANANVDTTDVTDNWDRTEVTEGVDDVGSGAGQGQLCGSIDDPSNLPVDFARSSKPSSNACNDPGIGYAKDAAPVVDFPTDNPSVVGTVTSGPFAGVNGGVIGPLAAGWLPGDNPLVPSGTALTNVSNVDNGGGVGSTVYRIWCATSAQSPITDWGQLTNLGAGATHDVVLVDLNVSGTTVTINSGAPEGTTFPAGIASGSTVKLGSFSTTTTSAGGGSSISLAAAPPSGTTELQFTLTTPLAVGQGIPFGLFVRPLGVNTGSGTEATMQSYATSGVSTGNGCASNVDPNAPGNPTISQGPGGTGNPQHIALENNAAQVALFAVGDFAGDAVDQAVEIDETLYFESNGVYNTDPYAGAAAICSNGAAVPCGTGITTFSYTASKVNENGESTTSVNILNNIYPTARTLFNVIRLSTLRASVAGFVNWMCDANSDIQKGVDNSTGKNTDTELNTIITGTFGFLRLTDKSVSPNNTFGNPNTPADNVTNGGVNTSGAAGTVADGSLQQGNGTPAVIASDVANPNT